MYFSSSITVIILLKYRYRQYRYRLENEYRYRQKKWYRYTSSGNRVGSSLFAQMLIVICKIYYINGPRVINNEYRSYFNMYS